MKSIHRHQCIHIWEKLNFSWIGKCKKMFLLKILGVELIFISPFLRANSSANATPEFEGRGGEDLALELSDTLTNAYESPLAFDLRSLCILPGQHCWKLYVDILVNWNINIMEM